MNVTQSHTNGCNQERAAIHNRGQDLLESQYQSRKTAKEGTQALNDIKMRNFVKDWIANRKVIVT